MFDAYRADDVFGFNTLRINSQGSVATVEPSVHVCFFNEAFDEEFVSDLTSALEKLRGRIEKSFTRA